MGGYTPTVHWVGETAGRSYFLKVATTPLTAKFLRRELGTYASARAAFMLELIAEENYEKEPILLLEDLSQHFWPPPWRHTLRRY